MIREIVREERLSLQVRGLTFVVKEQQFRKEFLVVTKFHTKFLFPFRVPKTY